MPAARATAAPPLLPPHVLVRSYGLRVTPKTSLNVCDPAPNSGVFVLPIVMVPAARSRWTSSASSSGTNCANTFEPNVVRMPLVGTRSLWATGSPCSGPTRSPRASAASAFTARSRASSGTSVTMALRVGLTRSIAASWASITSRAETCRSAISRASVVAGRKHRSVTGLGSYVLPVV